MTTVTTDMKAPAAQKRAGGVNRRLVVAVAALAAVLVGLGAWVLVDRLSGGGTDEITALVDRNLAAMNAADAAAAAATYTEDAVINLFGEEHYGRQEITASLQGVIDVGTQLHRVSDVAANGEYVSFFHEWTNELGMEGADLSVMQIENGLIAAHWEFNLREWPPLDF